jgi:cation diffusion facilitator CzcD-associated flavoprotein CzcO
MDELGEHYDVLIIGAGLSGIGAACHLEQRLPGKTYAILEARQTTGGTWDLFRYPGVRADSDMFTLGYAFKPWRGPKAIADGGDILDYLRETAREHGLERRIRFGHRLLRADWSSETARWTVTCEVAGEAEPVSLSCGFLHFCTGYYSYDGGYTPQWEGVERFGGAIVHPQFWPADLDYAGKRIVVIGSGATAVTLVPALAGAAAHVTMLQRSPTYILSQPPNDAIADVLRRVLPPSLAHRLARFKQACLATALYQLCRRRPRMMRRLLRRLIARKLPPGYDIDRHFAPRYEPWDQRLCIVPDGDLFAAIGCGSASVATDVIETFTENGIRLASGEELPADIIVTATGLELRALGGVEVAVDGEQIDTGKIVSYKGVMFCGIPNAALSVGYTNASWTLKTDLISEYVCRLLAHMDDGGYAYCVPVAPDDSQARLPLLDLTSGYVLRASASLPKQAERAPWRIHQIWFLDLRTLRRGPIEDEGLRFVGAERPVTLRGVYADSRLGSPA